MSTGVCSVIECDKQAKAPRGWCWGHYHRWRKYGDPLGRFVRQQCSADCNRPSRSGGMCDMHYRRTLKHGDPNVNLLMARGQCKEDGCESRAFGKELCQKHYYHIWISNGGRQLKAAASARRRALEAGSSTNLNSTLSWLSLWEQGYRLCVSCSIECDPNDFQLITNRAGRKQKICGPAHPSLDHRIPLSRGGPHTDANVDLMCLGCNRRKCANVARPEHYDPRSSPQSYSAG